MPREIGMPRDDEAYGIGGPEIGSRNAVIRRLELDLTLARERVEFEFAGKWLWAIDSVGLDANVDVFFSESIGQPVNFKRGQILAGYPFHRLYITHDAQPSAKIVLHTSMQMLGIQNAITQTAQVMERGPDLFTTAQVVVGAAPTLVAAASPTRRRLLIRALAANTAPVYIINVLGAIGIGYELAAGQELELRELTFDVYGVRGGVAQTVCVLEELNVA